jgi:hypothetical protein
MAKTFRLAKIKKNTEENAYNVIFLKRIVCKGMV